jgi:hypothetical protein
MIASGTLSTFLPPRAPRSRARAWSQQTIPVVFVPEPSSATAKPAVRAKLPPLLIGTTMGTFRCAVERLRRHDQDQTAALLLVSLRGIKRSQPDIAALHLDQFATCGPVVKPFALYLAAPGLWDYIEPAVRRGCSAAIAVAPRSAGRYAWPGPFAPGRRCRISGSAGGTANMIEPPALRRFVVCMASLYKVIFKYNICRRRILGALPARCGAAADSANHRKLASSHAKRNDHGTARRA